jgi:CRP-like cAMP-binding protein
MNDHAIAMSPAVDVPAPVAALIGRRFWQQVLDIAPLLTATDAQALEALAVERSLAGGDWIFTHRTPARTLVLLLEGSASLGHSDGAAMAPERVLHGPAWLDAASAWLGGATHTLDARALGAVRVVDLPRATLQALLLQRPTLAPGFLAALAQDVQRLSMQTHELLHKDANSRLAGWLFRHLRGPQMLLHLNERKRDIAAQLGMSPETLSRQMRQLSRRGLIEVNGYQVRVLDSDGLQRLAQA